MGCLWCNPTLGTPWLAVLTETDGSSHWSFVAQFILDVIFFPLFCFSSRFQQGWMSFPVRAAGRDETGFGFIFPFTRDSSLKNAITFKIPRLQGCSLSWFPLRLRQGEGKKPARRAVCAQGFSVIPGKEQKRCLGSLCSWAQQCVAKERHDQMSTVPSE